MILFHCGVIHKKIIVVNSARILPVHHRIIPGRVDMIPAAVQLYQIPDMADFFAAVHAQTVDQPVFRSQGIQKKLHRLRIALADGPLLEQNPLRRKSTGHIRKRTVLIFRVGVFRMFHSIIMDRQNLFNKRHIVRYRFRIDFMRPFRYPGLCLCQPLQAAGDDRARHRIKNRHAADQLRASDRGRYLRRSRAQKGQLSG